MKKLSAVLLAFLIFATSLSTPLMATSSTSSANSSSEAASASESSGSEGSSSSSSDTSSDGASSSGTSSDSASSGSTPSDTNSSADSAAGSIIPPPPFAKDIEQRAQAIYMVNLDSGTMVYSYEEQKKIYPASLNKIMTGILALEMIKNPDTETTQLSAEIQNYLYTNHRGAQVGGISMGESFTLRDLLYATLVQSANEAAMMVADYVAEGDMDYFVELMNQKAKQIGAKNTHFSNPTGLFDENNYSTAYDLALIAEYAMQNDAFVEIVTTNAYTSKPTAKNPDGVTWHTTNYMQVSSSEYYYDGLRGVKTGTLDEQNIHNLISTATRDGYTYLVVMIGAPYYDAESGLKYEKNLAFVNTQKLYDWAFKNFTVKTLLSTGKEVTQVGVRLSWDTDHVKLLAADKFATLVYNEITEDSVTPQIEIYNSVKRPVKGKKGVTEDLIDAPVQKGAVVGEVRLMVSGQEVGRVRLVAAETIESSKWLEFVDQVQSFLNTFLFKFVFTFVILILLLYIVLMVIRNRNRRRYKMRRRRPPNTRPPDPPSGRRR